MVGFARTGAVAILMVACAQDTLPPPVTFSASGSAIRLDEDGSASVILEAQVFNSDEPITYEIVDQPALGQLVGTGSVLEYVGNDDANGDDSFTWKAVAGDDESDPFTVDVFIAPVNDAPRGQPASLTTEEDLAASDSFVVSDAEGDELVFALVQAPDFGRVDLSDDGTYTYTPDANFVGTDFFLWSAQDPAGASTGPVRVDVNVSEINDPPVIQDDGIVTQEDRSINGQVVGSDPDGDPLTWTVVTQPTNGSLAFNSNFGSYTYTPDPNFFGRDFFEVVANDGAEDSAVSTIDITVTSVNDIPVVPPTAFSATEDTPLTETVLATDIEGQPLTFRVDQPPRNGIVSVNSQTGEFTYTPNANTNGIDDFTVIASDTTADSLPGRITISVSAVNDAPTLVNVGLVTTDEDVPAAAVVAGLDAEGDSLLFSLSSPPANGTVTVSPATGALVYVPDLNFNGSDQFSVEASDGDLTSDPAVVDILVLAVNDAPIPGTVSINTISGVVAEAMLTADDPEGDPLVFLITGQPNNGTAVVDSVTGLVTYTPDAGYAGPDAILWSVTDGELTAGSVLPINISPDSDGDGIGDDEDNCIAVPNEDQNDVGNNGVGDLCDCYEDSFDDILGNEFFAATSEVSLTSDLKTSDPTALRLNGPGAFVETIALPGCSSFYYELQVAAGPPAPEVTDSVRLWARADGGVWVNIDEVFGTGQQETFQTLSGQTDQKIALSGAVAEFRIEVIADEFNDIFFIDDLKLECDEDADFLVDCFEATLPGFDLTSADADMDTLLDGEELALGTDPNNADTDFDTVPDNLDNCPTTENADQADDDGDGIGNACSVFGYYDDFDAATTLDPANWSGGTAPSPAGPTVGPFGVNSVEVGGTILTGVPYDFTQCTDVAVNFMVHNRDAEGADDLLIQYSLDGGSSWTTFPNGTITESTIGRGASSPWTPYTVVYSDPASVGASFQVRFDNDSSLPTADRFYVDSVAVDCDNDQDGLANVLERDVLGTGLSNPDSDGNGTNDGDEFLNGTLVIVP